MTTPFLELPTSYAEYPEVIFGFTSAVGTPLELAATELRTGLLDRQYDMRVIKLSQLPSLLSVKTPTPSASADEYTRIRALMDRGNDARHGTGENSILAALAIAEIMKLRLESGSDKEGHAYLLRQLKHPDEAYLLRKVYEEGFHLIGVHAPPSDRVSQLKVQNGLSDDQVGLLMQSDEYESESYGQRVRDTFYLSDVFVRATGDQVDKTNVKEQISRFLDLLFGDSIHTPTVDEYGMFLASTAGLRSAQLSRQVGAAILTANGEVISIGTNEVPKAGGGQYWEGHTQDGRDHLQPRGDSTDYMRRDVLEELLAEFIPDWADKSDPDRQELISAYVAKLKHTRAMNLTEFTRAVHAEMEAISAAARQGVSVRGATLYTTTFPCHNCTKHIVAAGIARVVYIEPYPKSMARDLHGDAIAIDEGPNDASHSSSGTGKVQFEAFVGIAPRRYAALFSMVSPEGKLIRRKDTLGRPKKLAPELRIKVRDYPYKQVEERVMKAVTQVLPREGE